MAATESAESLAGSSVASEPDYYPRSLGIGDTSEGLLVSEPAETIALTPAASIPEQELIDRIVAGNQQHGGDDPAATPSLAVPAPAAAPAQTGLPDEVADTITSDQAAAVAAPAGATGGLFFFPYPEPEQQMPSRLAVATHPFHLEAAGAAVAAEPLAPEAVEGAAAAAEAMSAETTVAAVAAEAMYSKAAEVAAEVAAEALSLKRIVRDARGRLSLDQIGSLPAAALSVQELAATALPQLYGGAMTDSRSLSSDALHGVPVPASPPTSSDGLQSTPSSPGQQEGAVAMGPTLQLLPPRLHEGDFDHLPRDFDKQFACFDGQLAGGIFVPKPLIPLRLDGDTPALSLDEWLLSTAVAAEVPAAAPSLLAVQAITEPQLGKAVGTAAAAAAVAESLGVMTEPLVAKAGVAAAATAVVAEAGAFAGEFTGGLAGTETTAVGPDQSYCRPLICEPEVERANERRGPVWGGVECWACRTSKVPEHPRRVPA